MLKYAKKDRRIKVINNKENLRMSKSLNKAIPLAKGKYINAWEQKVTARIFDNDPTIKERINELRGNYV
jgi:glycosyltransferase involved in cell wall biosynthesis